MAMTIGSWQKELHREQMKLGKIIVALRKKKDFRNAKKLQEIKESLMFLASQPLPAGHGGRMPGVMDPMRFMEYMYPKLSRIMAKVGRNNFDLLMDTIGHSDNAEKLSRMIAALGKHSTEVFSNLITTLSAAFRFAEEQGRLGGGGMTMTAPVYRKLRNSLVQLRDRINEIVDKLETDDKICDLIVFLGEMFDAAGEILMVIGHSDKAGKVQKMSDAEIVLEKDNVDCPCGSVTQINAKIVNTGNVKDSFSVEFSEGGIDKNLVIEAWANKKTTPELKPRESYDFVINIKPACSAYGVSQVGLSDRVRISVESVLEEVDKGSKYLRVDVK